MDIIRKNTFETNSSSSHSITISEDLSLDTIYTDEEGIIVLKGGKFGWKWNKYNDALTKANYAVTAFRYNEEKLLEIKNIISKQTGAIVIIDICDNSYIDHQSIDTLDNNSNLFNFIFNKNSWLFTGNDNEYQHPNFEDVPYFLDNVKFDLEYNFKVVFTFNNKELKNKYFFLEFPTKDDIIKCINYTINDNPIFDYFYFDENISTIENDIIVKNFQNNKELKLSFSIEQL